ncbi:MAG: methylmalonyl-CoA epimerase [Bacteroidetes bacterium]|nr:methylmalonyl-CoA epimerase [Bacteroidota bacterium]
MNKIEHLGIAVTSLAESNKLFADLLGVQPYKEEGVESESVITSFFKLGESKVELLESVEGKGAIAQYLEKRGPGIHHVALDVTDIEFELNRLQGLGFQLIHAQPKPGADGKKIAFLHPKTTNGVLIELCEDMNPA